MTLSNANHLQKPDCIHRTSDQKEDHSSQIKLPHLHMQLNLSFHYLTPQHQSLCTCVSPNWWQREDIIKISLMTNFTARLGIQQLNSLVFCILRKPIYPGSSWKDGWGEGGLLQHPLESALYVTADIWSSFIYDSICFCVLFYCYFNLCYHRHASKHEHKQLINPYLQKTENVHAFRALNLYQALHVID